MARAASDICDSLMREPWRWSLGHCVYDRDDGVAVWRANMPILNVSLYSPQEMRFSLKDKVRVWLAFRKWRRGMPLEGYSKPEGK